MAFANVDDCGLSLRPYPNGNPLLRVTDDL